MQIKVSAKNVFKILVTEPRHGLELPKKGRSKEDIVEETGQTVGVQDASFDVEEGQIFVVMGLSGSGKSTLVRMINASLSQALGNS